MLAPRGGIALVRCPDCSLVHATAGYVPRFLDDHYAERIHHSPDRTAAGPRPGSERKRHALALYDRLTGGRLLPAPLRGAALDIGCGTGLLLDLLAQAGYRTVGIERSPAAAEASAAGHEVLSLDIEDGVERSERFDLVTMTHLLEHLRRPQQALRWVRSVLRPSGFAIVEVPNWGDLARPVWGARYRPLELGDHVSFFERQTLADLVQRSGFRLHALWSAPQARTLVFPSLLSGLDVGLGLLRGRSAAAAADEAVGVARQRVTPSGHRLAHAAVSATMKALDRLDPLLEGVLGTEWDHGANLVAVLTPSDPG